MKSTALCADRYHAVMGNFALGVDPLGVGECLGNALVSFYITQRKIPYGPCVGHERLVDSLARSRADANRARFLKEDRAGLKLIAEVLSSSRFQGEVYAVPEGTIVFNGEPIAMVTGPFANIQMYEVAFEHAFDFPMTVAARAMSMKQVAGGAFVSDFTLRRSGDFERSVEASKYSFIGGLDDTSNLEAGFRYDIVTVGTMAHYLVQAFMGLADAARINNTKIPKEWYDENGEIKHGERLAFEYWLDCYPKGTVCLVDTISLESGMIHTIEAALSSPARRQALKAIRIDSGDLIFGSIYARRMLDINGLYNVGIILTGDLDDLKIREIREKLAKFNVKILGYGVGTKLTAEIDRIAGVIFKMISILDQPTLKCSETSGKETLPGLLQFWRCENREGRYIFDVIAKADELKPQNSEIYKATPLLQPFWVQGTHPELKTPHELKRIVEEEKKRFIVPLDQYRKERVSCSHKLEVLRERLKEKYHRIATSIISIVDKSSIEIELA